MWKLFDGSKAKKRRIYLDHASATPILPVAAEAVSKAGKLYGNPGAIHTEGVAAARLLKESRQRIAHELGAKAREIIFVSGGTEGNNLAILGFARQLVNVLRLNLRTTEGLTLEHSHWIVSSIEHPSVLECFAEVERLGGNVDFVDPDGTGIIRAEAVARLLRSETVFVSVGWANSEIGVIQPLSQIARVLRAHEKVHGTSIVFHSDAGQAPLYLASNIHSLDVDLLTIDSGKLYGPRGIGCVYVSDRVTLAPTQLGGSQERGLRAGTENVALAAGFAAAFATIASERTTESKRLQKLRDDLASEIVARLPAQTGVPAPIVNGDLSRALPYMLNISVAGIKGEYVVLALDHAGIAISTKSACREGEARDSHVVKALASAAGVLTKETQVNQWRAQNTLRFSLGRETTAGDITRTIKTLVQVITEHRAQ